MRPHPDLGLPRHFLVLEVAENALRVLDRFDRFERVAIDFEVARAFLEQDGHAGKVHGYPTRKDLMTVNVLSAPSAEPDVTLSALNVNGSSVTALPAAMVTSDPPDVTST